MKNKRTPFGVLFGVSYQINLNVVFLLNAAFESLYFILKRNKMGSTHVGVLPILFGAPQLTSVEHLSKNSEKPYGIRGCGTFGKM